MTLHLARIVLVWFALALALGGVGLVLIRVFGRRSFGARDILLAPFLGWCCAIGFLQIWHLWLPVDERAAMAVGIAGVSGLVVCRRPLVEWLRPRVREAGLFLFLAMAVAFWLANHTAMQPKMYDSGLYHLNAVRWVYEYPIVPGLGNLHGRLAYNNSSFLYTAMLDVGYFKHRSHELASGFLILLVLTRCLHGFWRTVKNRMTRWDTVDLYDTLFGAPVTVWAAASGYASAPSPDVPVFTLGIVVGGELLRLLTRRNTESDGKVQGETAAQPGGEELDRRLIPAIVLLCATGMTAKLSFVAYGTAVMVVAVWMGWRTLATRRSRLVCGVQVLALTGLLLGPWMARGIILSGYPAYPSQIGGVDVEWRVSEESAHTMTGWIKSWARLPNAPSEEVLGNLRWVWPWMKRITAEWGFELVTPLALLVLGLGLLAGRGKVEGGGRRHSSIVIALCTCLVGLVFWTTSPEPRYAGACFWVMGVTAVAFYIRQAPRQVGMPFIVLYSVLMVVQNVNVIDFVRTWKDPGPARVAPYKTMTTDAGLKVNVPCAGDQLWDAPLPGTPCFDRALRLRRPGELGSGFIIGTTSVDPRCGSRRTANGRE